MTEALMIKCWEWHWSAKPGWQMHYHLYFQGLQHRWRRKSGYKKPSSWWKWHTCISSTQGATWPRRTNLPTTSSHWTTASSKPSWNPGVAKPGMRTRGAYEHRENMEGEVPRHRGDQRLEQHEGMARNGCVYHRRGQRPDLERQPGGGDATKPGLLTGATGH